MSEKSRRVNAFFKNASKADVNKIMEDVLFSDRETEIFTLFYIKRKDVPFIADSLNVSADTVNRNLMDIRKKILRSI